ncbi:cytochrome c oxidase subunit 4 isoform 1, mitochondrial [Neocloeon triangulifer]|uniref:cytochrome c oxidase subunit 4 isoform 1, mitochondrial n=1 Tax=Neocloeon triangulifer TaxID=2078957 RepID=UPI00286EEC1F|nr:cytochrome c oxidase subunit 4 isoform 1, mitochondrial [Neocloeon triangulifer]XP_059474382.1 cytochrome c oxidase subunit 4 isoform 1, mitochondrial [Neocloeon triangulifer]
MANRLLSLTARQASKLQKACMSSVVSKTGNREVVGYGFNGQINYADRVDFPMPAVRFLENTPDILALREKEKGDWKKLSVEEKKALYRASFCQTFAEMKAPTGQWKSIVGITLLISSLSLWVYMAMKKFVYKPLPVTFDEDRVQAQLQRMIDLRIEPIEGLTSKYDYENNRWKE